MNSRIVTVADALKHAEGQCDSLNRELEAIENSFVELKIRKEEILIARGELQQHIDWLGKLPIQLGNGEAPTTQGRKAAAGQTPIQVIRDKAIALIRASDQPIPINDVFAHLVADSVVILGKNPLGNLSSKLNQIPGRPLIYLGKAGWWSTDRPYPVGNYYPGGKPTAVNGESGHRMIHAKKRRRGAVSKQKGAFADKPKSRVGEGFDAFALNLLADGGTHSTHELRVLAAKLEIDEITEATDLRSLIVRLLNLTRRKQIQSHGGGQWSSISAAQQPEKTKSLWD